MADMSCSVEVGESFITIADAKKNANLLDVANIGMAESYPAFYQTDSEKISDVQATVISSLVKKMKLSKRSAVFIIPDSFCYNQILEMPKLNEKELISAIRYQADQFIPLPLEEIHIDIEILSENTANRTVSVLIAAASKKIIEKIQRTAETAGLIPDSIETELSSTGRFLSEIFALHAKKQQGKQEGILFVNFSFSTSSLYYFDLTKNIITHTHNFNVGLLLFLKEIMINFNIDQKKAIDMLRTFDFTQNSSVNLTSVLTPAIKNFISQVNVFFHSLSEKYNLKVSSIVMYNEIVRFGSFEKVLERYFALPTSTADIPPLLVKNTAIQYGQKDLPFYIPVFGGNLK